ncbi:MAG: SapC family protein [Hyphomonas sp.]|nr:SapC family protein [Hyphomonas sp.]
MVDVFISYKRQERARVIEIHEALVGLGLKVWFDQKLTPGLAFDKEIDRALKKAKCAIVCWSPKAARSGWVKREARLAKQQGKIVPAFLEYCSPPRGYRDLHISDLTSWDGRSDHAEWSTLLDRIGDLVGRKGLKELHAARQVGGDEALAMWAEKYPEDPVSVNYLGLFDSYSDLEAPPGGSENLAGRVMFYKRPEPLNPTDHGHLGIKRVNRPFVFARNSHAIPITATEFGSAAPSSPLIFTGEDRSPVMVLGAVEGLNTFIRRDASVDSESYIPAFIRRYPFVFANDEGDDKLLLCIDRSARIVSDTPDIPFFENGEPSEFTRNAIEFCKEFERQRRATVEFVEELQRLDLFAKKSAIVRTDEGDEGSNRVLAEFWAVDEQRLNALDTKSFMGLKETGALAVIYAHLVSLLNWPSLYQRSINRLKSDGKLAQIPKGSFKIL